MDPSTVAQSFVKTYYENLDKIDIRPNLAAVYRDSSTLLFEGNIFNGAKDIMGKLMALPSNMARLCSAVDVLPLDNFTLLITVYGQQKTDQENDHALAFTHTFIVVPDEGNLVVLKEIFRIILHDV